MMGTKYGMQCACAYCGQDIEFHGHRAGWRDRGLGRECLPYTDRKTGEIVRPSTKHAPNKRTPRTDER
jgi:hypothetical protein